MIEGRIPSQNLESQRRSEPDTRPPGFYKSLVFDVVSIVSAWSAGYVCASYLAGGFSLTFLSFTLAVFCTFATIQVVITGVLLRRLGIMAIEIGMFLVSFYQENVAYLFAAAIALALLYGWGILLARAELENGVKLRFNKVSRIFLKKLVTALSFGILILYLPQSQKSVFISEDIFRGLWSGAADIAKNIYPQVDFNSTVSVFSKGIAEMELGSNPAFNALRAPDKQAVLAQGISQTFKGVEQKFGLTISSDEPLEKVAYDFIVKTLTDWRDQYQGLFMVGWFILAFFAIRGVGSLLSLAIMFVSFIVYQILLAADIVRIVGESVTKEVIGL